MAPNILGMQEVSQDKSLWVSKADSKPQKFELSSSLSIHFQLSLYCSIQSFSNIPALGNNSCSHKTGYFYLFC